VSLDGSLDEPAWQQAGVIGNLTQQSPHPGAATPYSTEVRVLVSGDTLYIGVTCFDPDPSRIAVHTMQRDGGMDGDDAIGVILDPFGDRTTGYFFLVNAAGARQDGVYTDPEEIPLDWDGIWDAQTRLTSQGWTAEIAIPSRTLRFPKGRTTWGFNVGRRIARDRVEVRWTGATLDAWFGDLRRAGELAGVEGLRQGLGLSISPYGLGKSTRDFSTDDAETEADTGLDVSYNLGPELAGVLTINTDFAETEVDTRQINLTRFPLFYPEKRQFFTDGANQFEFGIGLAEDFIPFFSRRVGLFRGEQVLLLGGVKLIGQEDGASGCLTQAEDIPQAPGSNLFAGRVTFDVDQHLRVGAIATNGNPDGVHDNSLAGLDATWRTSTFRGDKNLAVAAWAAGSGGDLPKGKRTGYGFKIDHPTTSGTSWSRTRNSATPRPRSWASAEAEHAGTRPASRTSRGRSRGGRVGFASSNSSSSRWWSRDWTVPPNRGCLYGTGQRRAAVGRRLRVERAASVRAPGRAVRDFRGRGDPSGSYRFDRYRIEVTTSEHRAWHIGTEVWLGTFGTGRCDRMGADNLVLRPRRSPPAGVPAGGRLRYLPQGTLSSGSSSLTSSTLHPDLILACYAQYDNDSDNLGVN
jgi:hypothetical protein